MADETRKLGPAAEQAYDRMLTRVERALAEAELATWDTLRQEIDAAVEFEQALEELTREELDLLGAYLKRDLGHLVSFVRHTGDGLAAWLHLDLDAIEQQLLDKLLSIADKTQVDQLLLDQKLHHVRGQYISGEVALAGMLRCLQCGHMVCLTETTRLQDCHICGSVYFERITSRWPHGPEVPQADA
ncbi:MAG: zinc ribbon-containing protein [Gammaproteobacteria bacterium]|nr:zinc ribbon-containing protein [Gammaproteobacteria bacterium]